MSTTRVAGYTQHGPIDVATANRLTVAGLGPPWLRAVMVRFDRALADRPTHGIGRTAVEGLAMNGERSAP